MQYNIIVAGFVDSDKIGIGLNGTLPWNIKADMDHFRNTTSGHCVLMGRNTWTSIPEQYRPLRNRMNYILTSRPDRSYDKAVNFPSFGVGKQSDFIELVGSVDVAFESYQRLSSKPENAGKELFVIGGAQLYEYMLNKYPDQLNRVYITEFTPTKLVLDVYFPSSAELIRRGMTCRLKVTTQETDERSGDQITMSISVLEWKKQD